MDCSQCEKIGVYICAVCPNKTLCENDKKQHFLETKHSFYHINDIASIRTSQGKLSRKSDIIKEAESFSNKIKAKIDQELNTFKDRLQYLPEEMENVTVNISNEAKVKAIQDEIKGIYEDAYQKVNNFITQTISRYISTPSVPQVYSDNKNPLKNEFLGAGPPKLSSGPSGPPGPPGPVAGPITGPSNPGMPGPPMPGIPGPSTPKPGPPILGMPVPSTPMPGPSNPKPGMPGPPIPGMPVPSTPMPGPSNPKPGMPGPPIPGIPGPPKPGIPGPPMPGIPGPPTPGAPMPGMPGPPMIGIPNPGFAMPPMIGVPPPLHGVPPPLLKK